MESRQKSSEPIDRASPSTAPSTHQPHHQPNEPSKMKPKPVAGEEEEDVDPEELDNLGGLEEQAGEAEGDDNRQVGTSNNRLSPTTAANRKLTTYDTDSSPSGTDSLTWIAWFCSLAGHEYFAEVAEDFIEDDFNLTGLMPYIPFYKEALEMILDVEPEDDSVKVPEVSLVETSAEILYGLIHQRYITTRPGLAQMNAKYESAHFGYCPRVFCQPSKVVPCGRSDNLGDGEVVLYCPNCMDLYHPPSSRYHCIDGAYFGTSFPHLLFQTYRESPSIIALSPTASLSSSEPPCDLQSKSSCMSQSSTNYNSSRSKIYGPRIYGFRVSERARSGPRMQWLRIRPRNEEQLRLGLEYHNRDRDHEQEES